MSVGPRSAERGGRPEGQVLHCIWRMAGGGAERQLGYLVRGLARRGWAVHVAVVFPDVNDALLTASGCQVHRIGGRGRFDPAIALQLARLVHRLRPIVAQTWLAPMDVLGGAVATALGVPWIISERSSAESYPPSLLHRVRARLGRRASAWIANSDAGAAYWRGMGADPARVHVVSNGVPLDAIDAAPAAPRAETGEALVAYVGRLSPEKNLPLLLDALAVLMRRRPARAVLCGDGRLRAVIQSRASALGIADRVLLPGFVPDVWSRLKSSDVMVALSAFEGHPNAVLEAMACGVPLVVSDIAAHRALLDETSARFVGESADVIAAAIESAIVAGRSAERTRRARARVAELSIDLAVRRHEEIYRVWNLRPRERH
jgi:glycosyltransferase involved in cell wall biosynthesis